MIWLWITGHRPVIFTQYRTGLHGTIFRLYKLRTMNQNKNAAGELLSDKDRLTKTGNFIRRRSIDEIPQLWNVLKGEMSLIGPRPLLVEYLPFYNERQRRRHDIKPGITGWAQVYGRNAISWEKKFEFDIWYVDHISLLLDLKIFILTIKRLLFPKGIHEQGEATMKKFVKK